MLFRLHQLAGCALALLIVAAPACTSAPAVPFHYGGVAFTCPAGWTLDTADLRTTPGTFTVSCERAGFNQSGLLTVGSVADHLDPAEVLTINKQSLTSNTIYQHANLRFQPDRVGRFRGHPARTVDFTLELLGVPHRGRIICPDVAGKTVWLVRQEALEDTAANAAGFRIIENNLTW